MSSTSTETHPERSTPTNGKTESPTTGFEPYAETGEKRTPAQLARTMLRWYDIVVDRLGFVYRYDKAVWRPCSEHELRAFALSIDTENHTTSHRRRETISQALALRQLGGEITWNQIALQEVPLLDCVVDVVTKTSRPHRRADWLNRIVPHRRSTDDCPRWMQALDEWFEWDHEREQKIDALQEFLGYCLLPHASYKKALFLHGKSDSGKSVVVRVLKDLVGLANCCGISVEDMDDQRKIAPIKGKALNILGELPSNALVKDGGFKRLVSTGDPVQIDQKWEAAEMLVPSAKHVFACNDLPRVDDRSSATFNRMLIIHFPHVFAEHPEPGQHQQEPGLEDIISREIAGILRWAMYGAKRLVENRGRFTRVSQSVGMIEEMRVENNPVLQFMLERTEPRIGSVLTNAELLAGFRRWPGGDPTITAARFGRQMTAAGFPRTVVDGCRQLKGRFWRPKDASEPHNTSDRSTPREG